MRDLHDLPKFRDGLSHLYVERCHIDQESKAIAIHDAGGKTPVPVSALALLMIGPGATITHAAVCALADNGCLVVWCGEAGVRFYAQGLGETHSARRLLLQARLVSDEEARRQVVMRMYQIRFPEPLDTRLTIQQIRGMEGARVRDAYRQAARQYGVEWQGRAYKRDDWGKADPVNRALSAANACLYGLCHAAILSAGYSPALGFVHTGKQLSFVYDIADLYKTEISIPVAFAIAARGGGGVDRAARLRCRDIFRERRLLRRVIPDIERLLDVPEDEREDPHNVIEIDADPARPEPLWAPKDEPAQAVGEDEPHTETPSPPAEPDEPKDEIPW